MAHKGSLMKFLKINYFICCLFAQAIKIRWGLFLFQFFNLLMVVCVFQYYCHTLHNCYYLLMEQQIQYLLEPYIIFWLMATANLNLLFLCFTEENDNLPIHYFEYEWIYSLMFLRSWLKLFEQHVMVIFLLHFMDYIFYFHKNP